jgi:hypothetical protein
MMTLKQAQDQMADLEKRRKHREPLTAAHAADQAALAAECAGEGRCEDGPVPAEASSKAVTDCGAEPGPGPGTFTEPVTSPGPEAYERPYLHDGRSAPSPQHGPPNVSPLPPEGRGILRPIELPGAPAVAGHAGPAMTALAAHQAQAQLRPPIPPGRTR